MFENIIGYAGVLNARRAVAERGHSLFARTALTLSLRPSAWAKEIRQTYLERRENMIKPILVSTDPCKQNIMKGADVDVLKFPIPLIHGGDSGTSERGTRSPRIRIVHLSIGECTALWSMIEIRWYVFSRCNTYWPKVSKNTRR